MELNKPRGGSELVSKQNILFQKQSCGKKISNQILSEHKYELNIINT